MDFLHPKSLNFEWLKKKKHHCWPHHFQGPGKACKGKHFTLGMGTEYPF